MRLTLISGAASSTALLHHDPGQGTCRETTVAMSQSLVTFRCTPEDSRGIQLRVHSYRQGWAVERPVPVPPRAVNYSVLRVALRSIAVP